MKQIEVEKKDRVCYLKPLQDTCVNCGSNDDASQVEV